MMRLFAILSIAGLLAACAATGPADYTANLGDNFGYTETKIESGRYRIVYRGSGDMPPEMVEDYALRRAAELTLSDGYDWFRVVGRTMDGEERGGVSVGAGVGTGSYGRRGGVSVGVGGDVGRIGAQAYFTSRIEILMGEGEKPEGGETYDAASVLSSFTGAYSE